MQSDTIKEIIDYILDTGESLMVFGDVRQNLNTKLFTKNPEIQVRWAKMSGRQRSWCHYRNLVLVPSSTSVSTSIGSRISAS